MTHSTKNLYSERYLKQCQGVIKTALTDIPAYSEWRKLDPGPHIPMLSRFASMPSLTKQQMNHFGCSGFIPPEKDMQTSLEKREIEVVQTSGTTSDQIANIWFQPWWNWSEKASWQLHSTLSKLSLGDHKEAILTSPRCAGFPCENGYLTQQERSLGRFLFLNERWNPTTWTTEHMNRMVEEINRFQPVILEANPTFIAKLCRHIAKTGRPVHNPAMIILTYENPSLLHYRIIKEIFTSPVASSYGSTEAGYVFMECEHGKLHQNVDSCHVDFIPFTKENGGPDYGRMLVTTFSNPWRVLFRFDIGDMATLSPAPCSCGRNEGLTLSSIEGRIKNVILSPSGIPVQFTKIDNVMSTVDNLAEYQIIQPDHRTFNLYVVPVNGSNKNILHQSTEALASLLGPESIIKPELAPAIQPDPPGKYAITKRLFDLEIDKFSAKAISNP